MSPSEALYRELRKLGLDFFVAVPCKLLADIIGILVKDSQIIYTPVTREEEGVGILAGGYLTGRRPALIMQNSGIGNSINAICSLLNYYRLPIVFIISHRGGAGEPIAAQKPMGEATKELLRAANVAFYEVNSMDELAYVEEGVRKFLSCQKSVAFLFPFSFWRHP